MAETADKTAPSPALDLESGDASEPYTPTAAAASERMASSVLDRLGGEKSVSGGSSWSFAGRVVANYLDDYGDAKTDAPQRKPPEGRISIHQGSGTPLTVLESFEPSEVVRAGLRTREAAASGSPLWSVLPPAKLEPLVAALETALGSSQSSSAEPQLIRSLGSSAPSLTLLQGSAAPSPQNAAASAPQEEYAPRPLPRSAVEASVRLLEALRAHASAQATAGADRISLGDMTQIAFAESRNNLAAAGANESIPDPKQPDAALGHVPSSKLMTNQHGVLAKIREVANAVLKEMKEDDENASTRYGDE